MPKPGLVTHRPWVIAHRGASGLLPEHTLPAYKLAIEQGADFIECDVILTRDLVPICRHEADLNLTTNVAVKFPDRVNTYTIDGETHTGIFAADLTLAEVKTLRAKQRWEFRDHSHDGLYPVATLSDFLDVVAAAPRVVGIYPEVKHPSWHASLPWVAAANITVQQVLLDTLVTRGYSGTFMSPEWVAAPVFIQSFEETSLKQLSEVTDLPLVLLLGGWPKFTAPDTGLTHEHMVSNEHLAYLATFISGVGPWKDTLYVSTLDGASSTESGGYSMQGLAKKSSSRGSNRILNRMNSSSTGMRDDQQQQLEDVQGLRSTGLAARLLSTGLQVHPYTLRDEARFVPPGVQEGVSGEFMQLFQVEGVTGAFADYPGTLRGWFDDNYQPQ
jgi:glycerophosphoryl diester phosphodiesterase